MRTFHSLGSSLENYPNQKNSFDTSLKKESRHEKHKNPNYYREYYQNNREKLLNYSHIYYGVKKLLKP
jgi:hypothetical protein